MKKITRIICCICMLVLLLCAAAPAFADSGDRLATVLFTHDLHSHLLPATNEEGESYGGYSRLMTAIDAQKKKFPDAILVDAGDFSMGSLFQTAYASEAIELRMMGAMGYDATTFGNHEYDYLPAGLASMLNSAVESGDPLPAIVECNYLPPESGEPGYSQDSILVRQAFDNYGVQDYILLERGGIYYVIFGLMGIDSDACAPNSGQILWDCAESAQRVVDEATALCREKYQAEPLVICLSHSGTENGKGEDYQLAKKVNGIDLIVSGHTHTALEEPIQVNGTYIVSAGEYSKYLGMAQLRYSADGSVAMEDYSLIPIDDALEEDLRIQSMTEDFKQAVEEKLGKLEKYFTPETDVFVTLSVEKERQKIEVTIPIKGHIIRSEQVSSDMYVSIDLVEEVIERQLKKYRTKLVSKKMNAAESFRTEFVEAADQDDEEVRIVRTKRFGMKPMYPEDACVQMELTGHDFFVFRNAETDEVNVVYKRKGNTYGLIEPEC